jgi:hypothetical protein
MSLTLAGQTCRCSDETCPCGGRCSGQATRYIKTAIIETLCETCSNYAVVKYGAREILLAEERWARFETHYPRSVKFSAKLGD